MDPNTFEYLKPTDDQVERMALLRKAFTDLLVLIEGTVPAGADRTYAIRELRTVSMWLNVAITRNQEGGARQG